MTVPATPLPSAVLAALERGQQIEAIGLLRAATGLGLKDAKDLIDAHLAGRPAVLPGAVVDQASLPPDALAALMRGNKIDAIRALRESTGMGLKQAKEAVEAAQRTLPSAPDQPSPGEQRRRPAVWLFLALLAIVALLSYNF
jgi:ribosomal protein L7/L12